MSLLDTTVVGRMEGLEHSVDFSVFVTLAGADDQGGDKNASCYPYHLDYSVGRRVPRLALQFRLGLLSSRWTRDNPDHSHHPALTRGDLAACRCERRPPPALGGRPSAERYRRQMAPIRNPSPIAKATAGIGRSRTASSSVSASEEARDCAALAAAPT